MIVSRAPLRFSLGGGGSDLPAYASKHGGYVISAAIDKYVYVTASRRFYTTVRLAYSKTELVDNIDDIEHPIFREALKLLNIRQGIELTSVAELPANSGLGSSSTFTVALLNALHVYRRQFVSSRKLAEDACHIEIDKLGEPIGKQDQYIAAFGNIAALTFHPDGGVEVEPVPVREEVLDELESNLVIVYSGVERAARNVLTEQAHNLTQRPQTVADMHRIKQLGQQLRRLLMTGDLDPYGELLHEHWTHKRAQAGSMSNATLDEHYQAARKAGALGGKLMGAGGGGFFMFYCRPNDKRRVIETMAARGLRRLRFHFDLDGARIVANMR